MQRKHQRTHFDLIQANMSDAFKDFHIHFYQQVVGNVYFCTVILLPLSLDSLPLPFIFWCNTCFRLETLK